MSERSISSTKRTYILGFGWSILLTLLAYLTVTSQLLPPPYAIGLILVLAIVQFLVQARAFLHLGRGDRWRLITLLFMVMVVLIIVVGSLWIMANLNYNMSPSSVQNYLNSQSGL